MDDRLPIPIPVRLLGCDQREPLAARLRALERLKATH